MNWKSVENDILEDIIEYSCKDNNYKSCNYSLNFNPGAGAGASGASGASSSVTTNTGQIYYPCNYYNDSNSKTIDVEDLAKCFGDVKNVHNNGNRTAIKNVFKRIPQVNYNHPNPHHHVNRTNFGASRSGNYERDKKSVNSNDQNHDNNDRDDFIINQKFNSIKMATGLQPKWQLSQYDDKRFYNTHNTGIIKQNHYNEFNCNNDNEDTNKDHDNDLRVCNTSSWFYEELTKQREENKLREYKENKKAEERDDYYNIHGSYFNVDNKDNIFHHDKKNNLYDGNHYNVTNCRDNYPYATVPNNNNNNNNRQGINYNNNHNTGEFNDFKTSNFCNENQWLRCPVADQCPTLNNDFNYYVNDNDNNSHAASLPCMDQYSDLMFYYGEDIGYLTPAQYQIYQEDSISNEKRKEKSRDAARCRRSRETDIFTELAMALPVPYEQSKPLDKASIMRLAIAYLKVRTVIDAIPEPLAKPEPSTEMDEFFLKALDGFMMVLSSDGDMVYLSENVSEYLGVSQMDMMGQNVYDYSHPCDHEELRECLSMKPVSSSSSSFNEDKQNCNLFVRLKCTLTSKGRKVNLKSASYKVIHCTGHMVVTPRDLSAPVMNNDDIEEDGNEMIENLYKKDKRDNNNRDKDNKDNKDNEEKDIDRDKDKGTGGCLVVVGCPVPHPSNIETPLGQFTFLSKHNLNMKFNYADEKLAEYLGWEINEIVGQSVFEFHHALDNPTLDKSFKSLFSKGQCETPPYRFLGKNGGYAWVVTQATLIHCAKQHKPVSVVCVNYIISGIECENEVYSARQLEARCSVDGASSANNNNNCLKKETTNTITANSIATANAAAVSIVIDDTAAVVKNISLDNKSKISEEDNKNIIVIENNNNNNNQPKLKFEDLNSCLPIIQEQRVRRPLSVTASLFRNQDDQTLINSNNNNNNNNDTYKKKDKQTFTASRKIIYPEKEIYDKTVSSSTPSSSSSSSPSLLSLSSSTSMNKNINNSIKNDNKNEIFDDKNNILIDQEAEFSINTKTKNPDICLNKKQIISDYLFQGKPIIKYVPVDIQQQNQQQQRVKPQVVTSSLLAPAPPQNQEQQQPNHQPLLPRSTPQTTTASIFAPRTKDMNKGFLTFSEDQPGLTMLKDEPEDLTHLAPTPGDVCVPLEDTQFFPDVFDEFILGNDNFCPLLSPSNSDLRSSEIGESLKDSDIEESMRNNDITDSLHDSDPFIYRDSPSSCTGSPNLLSPALSKSPGSIDSLCSPTGSGGGLSEDEMLMLSISDVMADDELSLRAPYIPMSDQDETLQLFISNDMVMWPQPPDKKPKWSNANENIENNVSSSLEQLLRTNSSNVSGKKYNDHGGGLVDPTDALGNIYKKNSKEENSNWLSKSERCNNKRLHCTTTSSSSCFDNDSKRIKCCDDREIGNLNMNLNLNVNVNSKGVIRGNLANVSSSSSSPSSSLSSSPSSSSSSLNCSNSQLLQQLISQQSANKNRCNENNNTDVGNCNGNRMNGNVNGSCGSDDSLQRQQLPQHQHQRHQQQQSNSVLMNLLVSGCDEVIDPRNIPPLINQKLSPLTLNLDNQNVAVSQLKANVALDHLSPDTRNELVDSMPKFTNKHHGASSSAQVTIEPMDFDNFEFDVNSLSPDLLQSPDLLKILANNLV